ncbi:MAG: hypothetical protein OSJ43_06630 [Oscillospiraceae bacterium]|nr:hypothetical protein [Oscillospiraceae bacterium]
MYILQVKYCGRWKYGVNRYDTEAEATARVKKLASVGIKARVKLTAELNDPTA